MATRKVCIKGITKGVMGPLEGIRIIDLTSMLSGPWATMILADQGADVIKVEEPRQGDHTRSYGNKRNGFSASFLNLNRNKRSVAIDLKTAKGVELVKRLAAGADVLVQNFRPGVVERLGVDEAAIRAVAPGIVYVSINGFGEKGPYAKKLYDPSAGVLRAHHGAGGAAQRPRLIRTVRPDKLTAVTAAQAIAAALVGRLKTGKGQHVRLAMLDAVLAFLWASDMGAQTYVGEKASQRAAASFIDLIYETNRFMTAAVMTNKEGGADPRARAPRLARGPALHDHGAARREHRRAPADDAGRSQDAHHGGMAGAAGGGAGAVLARAHARPGDRAPANSGQRHPARERPPR
jgi:crotonobetainyl-CoA:carnitine CoA-transferase CaiB-like acyl-CoA transferase